MTSSHEASPAEADLPSARTRDKAKSSSPNPSPGKATSETIAAETHSSPSSRADTDSPESNGGPQTKQQDAGEPEDNQSAEGPTDTASPPPLPDEPLPKGPTGEDDGWDPMWSDEHQEWYFFNRFTEQTQWENPRVRATSSGGATGSGIAGGYNPAIHGDYDPNAWYAKSVNGGGDGGDGVDGGMPATSVAGVDGNGSLLLGDGEDAIAAAAAAGAAAILNANANANADADDYNSGSQRYSHDAKTGRQMNAYFDMAAASSAHDGRSLKAERSGKKPSRAELKAFKEKRRAKKEEKRRAWLRD